MNMVWSSNVASYFGLPRQANDWGIEIEVEGGNVRTQSPAGWNFHEEGSLRNGGAEFVTAGPISLESIEMMVNSLAKSLANARVNNLSHRAGVHIHRNFTNNNILVPFLVMSVYYCYEPFMLKMLGQQRNGNLFCLPSYDVGDQSGWFPRIVQCLFSNGYDWPERGRYSSLNADSIRRYGTLEWRVFPFTLEGKKIRTWAGWIESFTRDGLNLYDSKEFLKYIENLRKDPIGSILSVFEKEGAEAIGNFGTDLSSRLVEYGLEQAYEYFRPLQKNMNTLMKQASDKKTRKREIKKQFTITDDIVMVDDLPTQPPNLEVGTTTPGQFRRDNLTLGQFQAATNTLRAAEITEQFVQWGDLIRAAPVTRRREDRD